MYMYAAIQQKVWFGLVLWYVNNGGLFNAKSCLYIHNQYIWFVNILLKLIL